MNHNERVFLFLFSGGIQKAIWILVLEETNPPHPENILSYQLNTYISLAWCMDVTATATRWFRCV